MRLATVLKYKPFLIFSEIFFHFRSNHPSKKEAQIREQLPRIQKVRLMKTKLTNCAAFYNKIKIYFTSCDFLFQVQKIREKNTPKNIQIGVLSKLNTAFLNIFCVAFLCLFENISVSLLSQRTQIQ